MATETSTAPLASGSVTRLMRCVGAGCLSPPGARVPRSTSASETDSRPRTPRRLAAYRLAVIGPHLLAGTEKAHGLRTVGWQVSLGIGVRRLTILVADAECN